MCTNPCTGGSAHPISVRSRLHSALMEFMLTFAIPMTHTLTKDLDPSKLEARRVQLDMYFQSVLADAGLGQSHEVLDFLDTVSSDYNEGQ